MHMASVWVPYTSEGKEAIASYTAIVKEVTLALQEAARKLGLYVSKKRQSKEAEDRLKAFDIYAGELCEALSDITGVNTENIHTSLKKVIEEKVGDTSIVLHGKGMEIQGKDKASDKAADEVTDKMTDKAKDKMTDKAVDKAANKSAGTPAKDNQKDNNENPQSRLDIFNRQENEK